MKDSDATIKSGILYGLLCFGICMILCTSAYFIFGIPFLGTVVGTSLGVGFGNFIFYIVENRKTIIKNKIQIKKKKMVDILKKLEYFCTDKDLDESYKTLLDAKKLGNGNDFADFYISIVEDEDDITVNRLLKEIQK